MSTKCVAFGLQLLEFEFGICFDEFPGSPLPTPHPTPSPPKWGKTQILSCGAMENSSVLSCVVTSMYTHILNRLRRTFGSSGFGSVMLSRQSTYLRWRERGSTAREALEMARGVGTIDTGMQNIKDNTYKDKSGTHQDKTEKVDDSNSDSERQDKDQIVPKRQMTQTQSTRTREGLRLKLKLRLRAPGQGKIVQKRQRTQTQTTRTSQKSTRTSQKRHASSSWKQCCQRRGRRPGTTSSAPSSALCSRAETSIHSLAGKPASNSNNG